VEQIQPAVTVGDHELIRKISAGSYGEVWLARNELGTYRAVKIVQQTRFDSSRPFQREYEGIKKFEPVSRSHEGLVDVLQVGRGERTDSFYCVMELADDLFTGQDIDPEAYRPRTLASEVTLKGALPADQYISIGIQLCNTLAFLHERGLIHRDIKPSNVIFVGNQPKLADVGLVAGIDDAKTMVGTIGFIPPEGPNSAQADIFSLGKLLYEISTGRDRNEFPALPEQADSTEEFLELNEVLLKACHTDISQRYRSALAMAADLKVIANGKSVRRLHDLETRFKRFRKTGALLAAVLFVFAITYYGLNQRWQRAREEQQRLVGSKVAEGTALLKQGDLLGALPSFAEALGLDNRPEAQATHRLRIGSALAVSPRIDRTWHLPERPMTSCTVHGRYVLVNLQRKYSQVFDIETGEPLSQPLGLGAQPQSASFTPDGTAIIAANWDETVRVIDWKTKEVLLQLPHPATVLCANANQDGGSIISGCEDNSVRIWDCAKKTARRLSGHTAAVLSARFSPSGRLAVTTGEDKTARVWDLQSGTTQFVLHHESWVYSADFSPDERIVATASYDNEVKLWDLSRGEEITPALRHPWGVHSVRFSRDGELILTGCLDGTARLWHTRTHQLIEANYKLQHKARLMDACFGDSPDQVFTAAVDGTLTLWRIARNNAVPTLAGRVETPLKKDTVSSLDGHWTLQMQGGPATLLHNGQPVALNLPPIAKTAQAKFDGKSSRLLIYGGGTNVLLVDLGRTTFFTLPHPYPITFADFSPDGLKLVCAAADITLEARSAQLWNTVTGKPIGRPLWHSDGVIYAAFSPDSRWVITTGEDYAAIVWDASSGKRITPKLEHKDKVVYASFARTRPWVVTASDDGTAIIWDQKTGDPLTPPFKHATSPRKAEFIEGDSALLTTDRNNNQWRWPLIIDARPIDELLDLTSSLAGNQSPNE
jgi:WD40 repeat protein/serine/threonine protein kinase